MDAQLGLRDIEVIEQPLSPTDGFKNPMDRYCPVSEKAAFTPTFSPWVGPWLQHGMYVVKTDDKTWEAAADRMVGPIEAIGCGGWDKDGALHHVGFDLDVAHGNEKDAYASTEEAIQAARQIRDLVSGAAEIRHSKGGAGIHVRVQIAPGAVPTNGRKLAASIAKWIAAKLNIKCDRTVLGRQNLWVWARQTGEHGFELVEPCVGSWTPPPEAMQEASASTVTKAAAAGVASSPSERADNRIRHDIVERASRYAEKKPPAVSGNGGHDASFHTVCTITHGFDLSEAEAMLAMETWNRRCKPPWSEAELRHKVKDALKAKGPRGYLLKKKKTTGDAPPAVDIAVKYLDTKGFKAGEELRLRYYREDFWKYNGTRYELIRAGDMEAEIVGFLQSDATTRASAGPALAKMVLSNLAAITLVKGDLNMPVWLGNKPEPARDLIVLANGVLDVARLLAGHAETLRPHSPNLFTSIALPFEYKPGVKCPTWRKFLAQVQPDPQVRRLLREWFGYCLTHDVSMQKLLMMQGNGADGKTVVCAVLKELLGEANVSAVGLEAFNPARTFPLAAMDGKLANISAEIGELDRAAEGLVKQIVSSDPITVERKHRDPFLMTPTARLVFATNALPRFADRSDGIWRRLLLVPFNVQIPEKQQDRRLTDPMFWRSSGELPGILNWALLGRLQLRRRGRFQVPPACANAAGTYREESNPARTFLQENCRCAPGYSTAAVTLYACYHAWCERTGHKALNACHFGREVGRTLPECSQSDNAQTVRNYKGESCRSRIWHELQLLQ